MSDKKGSPEGKKEAPEGNEKKKLKSKAFPLGSSEGNEVPQEIPSGSKEVPEGNQRKSSDSSQVLKETTESPSGKKEANMPLDEEGKQYVDNVVNAVKAGVDALKEKVGSVDKVIERNAENTNSAVGKVEKAIETLRETLPKTGPATETKDIGVDEERVADKVTKRIREQEEQDRIRRERDETARKQREEDKKFREWCLMHPEAKGCKNIGELITKVVKQEIEESSKVKKEEPATPKAGLEPLEKMTDQKRDTWTEEQNQARDIQVKAIVDQFNISANDQARGILTDPTNKENLVKKTELRESFIKTVTDDETLGIIKARCEGDACQVKFREGGITVFKLGEDGKWTPLDKEVAKQMKALF